jgi:hypothetical protein
VQECVVVAGGGIEPPNMVFPIIFAMDLKSADVLPRGVRGKNHSAVFIKVPLDRKFRESNDINLKKL